MTPVRLEPAALRSRVKHSTTEPLRSLRSANKALSWHTYDALFLSIADRMRLNAVLFGPQHEKTCLRGVANNTGADQPAHPRRLISAFVIRFLESILYVNFVQVKFQFSS